MFFIIYNWKQKFIISRDDFFYSDFECTILGNITSNLPKEVKKKQMGQVKLEFNPKTENIREQDPNPKVHLTRQIPSVHVGSGEFSGWAGSALNTNVMA